MTIRAALTQAAGRLQSANVPDARLDAEYLLAEVLHAPRLLVVSLGDRELTDPQLQAFESLADRREKREPLQYILGTQDFMGMTFYVTPDVLIPRMDTETLCEQALLHLESGMHVLDLCTGSGAIGISLKKLCAGCSVTLADISGCSLEIARRNAAALDAHVEIVCGDLFAACPDGVFDMIVSNPPYIRRGDLPFLQEEVKREPVLALDGGESGLDFYKRIIEEAPAHLSDHGFLLLEIGDGERADVKQLLSRDFDVQIIPDLNGLPRVAKARRKGA